ncbi:MAG: hypothetical protein MSH11_04715 [Ruminococcus sp.]|nr:hypothetical protein [Ruminococcus sp.]
MKKESAYIFTKGSKWFIDYYSSLEEAEKNAPDGGYSVNKYTTTKQIP